jgi:hypothetical protein
MSWNCDEEKNEAKKYRHDVQYDEHGISHGGFNFEVQRQDSRA